MKWLRIAGILLGSAAIAVINAQAADQSIGVKAIVAPYCTFTMPPQSIGAGNFTQMGAVTAASSSFQITNPVDANGVIKAATLSFFIPTTCNAPATVSLTTLNGGLKDNSPVGIDPASASVFRNVINYTTTATLSGAFASLTTNGTAGATDSSATTGATSANLNFNLTVNSSISSQTQIVTAGDYADVLTISVTPQ